MASPETSREYSQDNKKENFSSQEAEKVLKETKDELSSLKLDIFNKSSKKEIKGWDINELEKASELIWSFYEIKKDPTSTKLNNEIVTFNIDAVKSYLETLYKRLSAKDAPWYSIMAQEKIFWSAVLAIQIALESIYRPAPQVWTYDVWVINWKLDDKTKEVITDFQRDFIWSKWADWKPGKNTIWKIIEKLWDKYATIDRDKKPRINLNFPARPEIAEKDNNILWFRWAFTSQELKNRLQQESSADFKKYGTTKAVRTNNPWNIQDKKWWDDYIDGCIWYEKSKHWKFTVFNTPQDWWNALVEKIKRIQSWLSSVYHPTDTIKQYFKRYDPGNSKYPYKVAWQLWVNINTKIWNLDPEKFASVISLNEDGSMYKKLRDKNIITDDIVKRNGTKS